MNVYKHIHTHMETHIQLYTPLTKLFWCDRADEDKEDKEAGTLDVLAGAALSS